MRRAGVALLYFLPADALLPSAPPRRDLEWPLNRIAFSLLPLAGAERRKTAMREIKPGQLWTFDQIQGVLNVNVPVRMTVIKLREGSLWVHNPVAPTGECLDMVRELEKAHGKVSDIVLGTLGLEHKALAGPFSRCFPQASVWCMPGQWSFPLPLPLPLLGFPSGRRLRTLPDGSSDDAGTNAPQWAADGQIAFEVLGPLKFPAVGAFGETAFFHRDSATLLLTDTIIRVDDEPEPIIAEDPRTLMYHARDDIFQTVSNSAEARRVGWRRNVLFGLTFYPSSIDVRLSSALTDRAPAPMAATFRGLQGALPFGLYPWAWTADERPSFEALQGGLLVAPILQALILNRFPDETRQWARRVSRWPFRRIVPCHLANDIRAGSSDFLRAFDFLDAEPSSDPASSATPTPGPLEKLRSRVMPGGGRGEAGVLDADLRVLKAASDICTSVGLTDPPKAGSLRSR